MDITGFDYEIISNVSYFEMRSKFEVNLKNIWNDALVDIVENTNNERIWLFFAENKENMEQEDKGYELDEKGEGCFSIIATKLSVIDQVYAVIDPKRNISSEIRLAQTDLWSYTLILPDLIENNIFSKTIYESIRTILTKGLLDEAETIFDQRASQFYIE
jgi:hypothetical protein